MQDESKAALPTGAGDVGQPFQPYQSERSAIRGELPHQPSQWDTADRRRLLLTMTRVTPYLPLVSALVLMVAVWLPWMTITVDWSSLPGFAGGAGGPSQLQSEMQLYGVIVLRFLTEQPGTATRTLAKAIGLVWTAAPLIGLLLGLFLRRQQAISRGLALVYGVWLAVATAVTVRLIFALLAIAPQACWQTCTALPVTQRRFEGGFWLDIGSLAIGWIALVGLVALRRTFRHSTILISTASYTTRRLASAGVITLGVTIWAFGLLAVPWATAGCTGLHLSFTHFVQGACTGVDGYDVLVVGLRSTLPALLLIELLATVGLYSVVTVWLPQWSRASRLWILCWSLLVTLLFAVSMVGVRATLANPPRLTYLQPEPWLVGPGAVICAIGILLVWLGGAFLSGRLPALARQMR